MQQQYICKKYVVDDLEPGMEMAKSLYSHNGVIWLTEGTVLTAELIGKLKRLGAGEVEVREYCQSLFDELLVKAKTGQESAAPGKRREVGQLFAIPQSRERESLLEQYEAVLERVRKLFAIMRVYREIDLDEIRKLAHDINGWVSHGPGLINFLYLMPCRQEYLVHHSIHVASISGLIGRLLNNVPAEKVQELTLCGLLHDIGSLTIPVDILLKPGSLSPDEFETVKSHCTRGFKLLQRDHSVSEHVLYGILQHHERMDGSGYPTRADGKRIHLFAKIVGVADVYDAMTSKRSYREKLSPFSVMRTLNTELLGKLDPAACTVFLEYLSKCVMGNIVRLSDGRKAQVVYWNQVNALPVVRTDDDEFLDLSRNKEITIVDVIDG